MMKFKESILTFFSLFGSISTILCCGLPIILVSLGMGAVFASISSNFPIIIWLAERSGYLFIITGIFLLIGGYFIFLRAQSCPTDEKLAKICDKTKRFNKILWFLSVMIFCISFFFKYILILFY